MGVLQSQTDQINDYLRPFGEYQADRCENGRTWTCAPNISPWAAKIERCGPIGSVKVRLVPIDTFAFPRKMSVTITTPLNNKVRLVPIDPRPVCHKRRTEKKNPLPTSGERRSKARAHSSFAPESRVPIFRSNLSPTIRKY
jgi:hypothetical protein